jgi:hypothetical protein
VITRREHLGRVCLRDSRIYGRFRVRDSRRQGWRCSKEVRAEPYTEQLVDSGIYGNRDGDGNVLPGATYQTRHMGTRQVEVRRRLDERDLLYHAVPDLRSVVRKLRPE